MAIAADAGVDVDIVTCDYDASPVGRNALKLRNSVVKLQEGGVVDMTKKTPKLPKKATNVEQVKEN
jgi:hypothetical protein